MGNVVIVDKESFEKKKRIFSSDGFQKIHVVSDFDRTLT
ncbi:unnamed protein product, partial [marine sediment metagenome]